MSYDAILARSSSIIYRPGGSPDGLVVTTWAQVQKFIAARQGAVTVYVDSSVVSPAPVDAVTGITECFGRVVLRGAAIDSLSYQVLQIEAGATLQNLYAIEDLNVVCNTTTATPALSFTAAPNGGFFDLSEYALLSNAATATMPAISIAAGKTLLVTLNVSQIFLHAPAIPLFDVPAGATVNFDLFDGSTLSVGYASGAGNVNLFYDNASATFFTPSGVVPALPALPAYFFQNIDDIWVNKVLDPTTMGAPVAGDVPVFNVDNTWHAAPLSSSVVLMPDVIGPANANEVVALRHVGIDPTAAIPTATSNLGFDPGLNEWFALPTATTLAATTWFIDPVAGSDANMGTAAGSALKTFAELVRRYGIGTRLTGLGLVTITIMNSLPNTDPIDGLVLSCIDTALLIIGTATVVRSGTLTAVTTINRTANIPWDVTDAAGTFNVNDRIRITAGPNAGNVLWVAKQLVGATQVRVSAPAVLAALPVPSILTQGVVAPGDAYVVETLTSAVIGRVVLIDGGLGAALTTAPQLYIQDLAFTATTFEASATDFVCDSFSTFINQCNVGTIFPQNDFVALQNCLMVNCISLGICEIDAGLLVGVTPAVTDQVVQGFSQLLLTLDFLIQGGAIGAPQGGSFNTNTTPSLQLASVGIFDSISDAVSLGWVQSGESTGLPTQTAFGNIFGEVTFVETEVPGVYGSGNAGIGIRIYGQGSLTYDPRYLAGLTVTGAGDFRVGQAGLRLETFSASDLGPIAVDQTWANLAASYASGGFQGVADNVVTGAFIRPSEATPTTTDIPNARPLWAQTTWFIDPANSTTLALDSNNGATAATPVLTYTNGIAAKWGTYSPQLRQDTTFTWLSSQPINNADPVIFTPIMVGAVATLQGTLGPAQQVTTGALAGVVPKNRTTKQLLNADLGFAATPGQIIHNTTVGKDSWSFVYKNVAGTVFAITQPLTNAPTPIDETSIPSEVDTWANGDTFVLYAPVEINLVRVGADVTAEYVPPNFAMPVQLRTLSTLSANGPNNSETYIGTDVGQTLVSYSSSLVDESTFNDFESVYWNCFLGANVFAATGSNTFNFFWGGAIVSSLGSVAAFQMDLDAIVGGPFVTNINFTRFMSEDSAPNQGIFYVETSVRLGGTQGFRAVEGILGLSGVWGPGTIGVVGMSRIFYNPVVGGGVLTFGNIGAIELNQQGNAVSFNPTTGLWSTLIPLTAANLDLPFAAGGFGGLAINVGGASLTNQAGA